MSEEAGGEIETEEADTKAEGPDKNDEYDWDEYFQNEAEEYASYESTEPRAFDYSSIADDGGKLHESLLLQLHLTDVSPKIIFAAEEIIWSLNEDGFLTEEPEDILNDLKVKKAGTEFEDEDFTLPTSMLRWN